MNRITTSMTKEDFREVEVKNYYGEPTICDRCGKECEKKRSKPSRIAICLKCQKYRINQNVKAWLKKKFTGK